MCSGWRTVSWWKSPLQRFTEPDGVFVAIEITDNPWDLFPNHRHIATETCGNEIVCDLSAAGGGRVFGLWHDPAAILLLAGSETEFVSAVGPLPLNGETLELPAGFEDRYFGRLTRAVSLPTKGAANETLGPAFEPWLADLPEDARVADLRFAAPGDGFEFGNARLARHPEALVFALIEPEKKPGLFGRLFGR